MIPLIPGKAGMHRMPVFKSPDGTNPLLTCYRIIRMNCTVMIVSYSSTSSLDLFYSLKGKYLIVGSLRLPPTKLLPSERSPFLFLSTHPPLYCNMFEKFDSRLRVLCSLKQKLANPIGNVAWSDRVCENGNTKVFSGIIKMALLNPDRAPS